MFGFRPTRRMPTLTGRNSSRLTLSDSPTIVSLIASATEIVCALGLRRNLIGVSHECDYPEDVKVLPTLSRPKLDPKQPGHEIDRRVRERVRNGPSVYALDVETLQRLAPDLIITQDHCEVCAVSPKDLEAATCSVTLKDTAICSLHPSSLEQVCLDFQRVANAAGVSTRGHELVRAFRQRLDPLRQQTDAIRPKRKPFFNASRTYRPGCQSEMPRGVSPLYSLDPHTE